MAIIGDRDYWSYPSGRFVRLYTDGCVVDSSTGLMGLCKKRKRYDTKEEAEAAAGDDKDRDPDYLSNTLYL